MSEADEEARVAAMPTEEFRAWVKTLTPKERRIWRDFRRQRSKDRYERKRLAALAAPPSQDWEARRERRREVVTRWRERNRERHRQAAREQWLRIKADPDKHAAYLAKKAEAMRRKREKVKA